MANTQLSGMRGVYLVAAELVGHGFVVSVTSRSAAGADLLVTTPDVRHAWSVQVKATIKPTSGAEATYFLLGREARTLRAPSHLYVFVSVRRQGTMFYVVPSRIVARHVRVTPRRKSTWYAWVKQDRYRDAWRLFGRPER